MSERSISVVQPTTVLGKTELGREESANRSSTLMRTERNLLLMADGNRTVEDLLEMISGSDTPMIEALVSVGFLEVVGNGERGAREAIGETIGVPELDLPLSSFPQDSPFGRLYSFLLAQIPHFFGMGAFLLTLKVEKASTLADLEPIQQKLLDAVQKKRGSGAAQAYRARIQELIRE